MLPVSWILSSCRISKMFQWRATNSLSMHWESSDSLQFEAQWWPSHLRWTKNEDYFFKLLNLVWLCRIHIRSQITKYGCWWYSRGSTEPFLIQTDGLFEMSLDYLMPTSHSLWDCLQWRDGKQMWHRFN